MRRACTTVQVSRSSFYRVSIKDDTDVEQELLRLAQQYPSRGFDWFYLNIRQRGIIWNRKRVLRVYRQLHLKLRRKHKTRINRVYERCVAQPILPGICWSMDFMSDALTDGRRTRLLNVIDDYNRESLLIKTNLSLPAERVTRLLDQVIEIHGAPEYIRCDNGPEFISYHFKDWASQNGIAILFIEPGKPHQNGLIERFNRTFREDVLDAYLFSSFSQLQIICDRWREQYNMQHPHQSLGGISPLAFKYSRRKIISAYEKVKAKLNDEQPHSAAHSSALTISKAPIKAKLCEYSKE